MASYKITRRQFLKWVTASAAILGLSKADILKIEESLATMTGCTPDFPNSLNDPPFNKTFGRVLWLTGSDCGGCPTSLLNYLADPNDPDPVLKAVATNGGSLGLPPLVPIADIETLTPQGGDNNLDIAEVVVEVVTVDWHYIVMAASGDPANQHMATLRGSEPFVLAIDGAIPTAANGQYCQVFSIPGDYSGGIWDPYITVYDDPTGVAAKRTDFTMAGAVLWLASSENCLAVVADGTCAAFGGVPAASAALPTGGRGNITSAKSAWEWVKQENKINHGPLNLPLVLNIPGCPPNSDWQIASIAAGVLELNAILNPAVFGSLAGILVNNLDTTLDHKGRPKLTYTGVYHKDANYAFCQDCPRNPTRPGPSDLCNAAKTAAKPKGQCMEARGCNGWMAGPAHIRPDCPTRQWNKFEDFSKNNWCVGNNMPCQGCASPGFPDYTSPFYKRAKYRY